ncbi:hypothetical protein [Shimia abyssi]|uniref:Uncharacterized protein n=1 Tax=Shimia abyssi TaxID=1662395 RepID=A0A2P8FFP6_9RHOB|nr:hypothetical protein [Shimia abyssi]PSL20531.1 hypothetical protein CLV88_103178 [Shimia abyssi]
MTACSRYGFVAPSGRKVEKGPENIYKRFDRWKYTHSVQETYRYLPLKGAMKIYDEIGPAILALPDDQLPDPFDDAIVDDFYKSFDDEASEEAA